MTIPLNHRKSLVSVDALYRRQSASLKMWLDLPAGLNKYRSKASHSRMEARTCLSLAEFLRRLREAPEGARVYMKVGDVFRDASRALTSSMVISAICGRRITASRTRRSDSASFAERTPIRVSDRFQKYFWLSVLTENWSRLYRSRAELILERSLRNGRSKRRIVTAREQGTTAS